jgi:hypothetical protein
MGLIVKCLFYGAAIVMALFALDELCGNPSSIAGTERRTNPWLFWTIVGSAMLLSGLLTATATLL